MSRRTFTCAKCGDVFVSSWSEADAQAEYEATMPNSAASRAEWASICDACHVAFLTWAERKGIEL